ncbi:MAG TPA: NAD(P)-dependent oxidoreductase [Nitrososphaeraceae archaeon]|nr:NAD(P)-dependent oxidoreductase [Nitrososphaeraceae archaeon]
MNLPTCMRVGIIGLGLMGSRIADRLIDTGHNVSVYNRDSAKTKRFARMGVKIATYPAELADNSDFIIICVTNFDAVKEISFGRRGIIESNNNHLIVADSSTVSALESKYCAELFRKKKIEMLGMPVMGGTTSAGRGELIHLISGNKTAFRRSKSVIKKISKAMFYIGENDGLANTVKLALNLNIALIATALSEGIALVEGSGIDPKIFIKILNQTYFRTGISQKKGSRMIENNFVPTFHLKNMLKDLDLAVSTAQYSGISLPLTSLTQQIYRAANNSGFSEQDYTAILAFIEKINGMRKQR